MSIFLQLSHTTTTMVESDSEFTDSNEDASDKSYSELSNIDEVDFVEDLGFHYLTDLDNDIPSDVDSNHGDSDIESDICSETSDSSGESIPFMQLLLSMEKTEKDFVLVQNGYRKVNKICDTLMGELIKAEVIKPTLRNAAVDTKVVIKKTDKALFRQHIAIQDDCDFFVAENCYKEAEILQQFTRNCNIVKYVDHFESESDFYLVMEYIDNAVTLKDFITESHQLMSECKLSSDEYSNTVQRIIWKLADTIAWLHDVVQSCHLDICCENVMIQNHEYTKCEDGTLVCNDEISIKLCDFGVAELFEENEDDTISFLCSKNGLSLDNEYICAPQIYNHDIYDGRSADIWSLGMVFYRCMVGKPLYEPADMWDEPRFGYLALINGKLEQYISEKRLLQYFKGSSLSLLKHLLIIDENERFHAYNVVKHEYFAPFQSIQSGVRGRCLRVQSSDRSLHKNM